MYSVLIGRAVTKNNNFKGLPPFLFPLPRPAYPNIFKLLFRICCESPCLWFVNSIDFVCISIDLWDLCIDYPPTTRARRSSTAWFIWARAEPNSSKYITHFFFFVNLLLLLSISFYWFVDSFLFCFVFFNTVVLFCFDRDSLSSFSDVCVHTIQKSRCLFIFAPFIW